VKQDDTDTSVAGADFCLGKGAGRPEIPRALVPAVGDGPLAESLAALAILALGLLHPIPGSF
jgi:hypothetical protein